MRGLFLTVHNVGKGFGKAVRGVARLVKVPFGAIRKRTSQRKYLAPHATRLTADDRANGTFAQWLTKERSPLVEDDLLLDSNNFPCQACTTSLGLTRKCQDLTATGSKFWGNWWDGRSFLRVKLYDFAVYMNSEKVRDSSVARSLRRAHKKKKVDVLDEVQRSQEVPMSLFVRAARNLPIKLLSREYQSILRRRLMAVGASAEDPGLSELADMFHEDKVPQHIKHQGSLRKGTLLSFSSDSRGTLSASVDNIPLGTINSQPLCAAIFDLYLGDNPVSKKARGQAGDAVVGYIAGRGSNHMDACATSEVGMLPAQL